MIGNRMTKRWMGGVALLPAIIAAPALAAPPTPIYNWTGLYVGANVGGAWGRFGSNTVSDCSGTPPGSFATYYCGPFFVGGSTTVNAAGSGPFNATGFTGGVQAGNSRTSFSALKPTSARSGSMDPGRDPASSIRSSAAFLSRSPPRRTLTGSIRCEAGSAPQCGRTSSSTPPAAWP